MRGTDIVAYTYNTENYCSGCIMDVLPTGEGQEFDGWALAQGVSMSVESNLREIAFAFSIDYDDLSSFDSGDFPKPIFASQIEDDDERCGKCHEPLIG
jgi:hypothetical protein